MLDIDLKELRETVSEAELTNVRHKTDMGFYEAKLKKHFPKNVEEAYFPTLKGVSAAPFPRSCPSITVPKVLRLMFTETCVVSTAFVCRCCSAWSKYFRLRLVELVQVANVGATKPMPVRKLHPHYFS